MHTKCLLLLLSIIFSMGTLNVHAQEAYQIYNNDGEAVSFEQMTKNLSKSDIVFFGEIHNQPISHWLTLELINAMHAKSDSIIFGMEMFERDQQQVLDELSDGFFGIEKLGDYTKVWSNFETDYKPIVKYCLDNNVPLIASNIPRRYASFVYSHGLDSLYSQDIPSTLLPKKDFIIDTTLASYAEIQDMAAQIGHGGGNLLAAQAIKDVMMAESIIEYYTGSGKNANIQFIHLNGVFHTKNKEGINWYVHQLNNNLTSAVISCYEVENVEQFQVKKDDFADYYIQINQGITKSYD